ncbi:MAG: nucleoside monophosphate kinase [Gomphosphaeria aponina SAG 52.96 = DSM 107014]|uniref:Adenylate kinase n=1 Tax=Gomphosphaeria aponina SAG 52.96 = DSM 107014 TaxID=1521640 RepID=A0A941GPJ5_9CHRO|nr:nucleoside monophosphate kinase [Gomphosphaeria aponina SAG 52.96 = DSM 107014]
MRLVMLGGPGAGKGTQSQKLSLDLQITVIATGDVLRKAMTSASPLGEKAREFVEKGELVPDEMMIQFMRDRLLQSDVNSGWILEGYPRTSFQAEELDFLLDDLQQGLDWAIYLQVSDSLMLARSLGRGKVDDQPEIIQRRIEMFYSRTIPILEYYEYKKRLLTVQAEASPEEVEQEIFQKLGLSS